MIRTVRRRLDQGVAAGMVAVLAVVGMSCSDDDPPATSALPSGLTMPSTTTSTTLPESSSVPSPGDTSDPGDSGTDAPLDSFTGVFRSTVVLGPADASGEASVVDVCTYLEDTTGATTSLLFGSDEDLPVDDVTGVIDDGRYGYVVPDGHDPGTDKSRYSTDLSLLRPGVRTEIEGSSAQIDPADAQSAVLQAPTPARSSWWRSGSS